MTTTRALLVTLISRRFWKRVARESLMMLPMFIIVGVIASVSNPVVGVLVYVAVCVAAGFYHDWFWRNGGAFFFSPRLRHTLRKFGK